MDIKSLNPYQSNYLYLLKEIYENDLRDHQNSNLSQRKKDIQYIYDMMMCQFMDIAWHLFVDWKSNIQNFNVNKLLVSKLPYKKFEVYNNIKWDFNSSDFEDNPSFIEEYFTEDEIAIFERIIKDYSHLEFMLSLFNFYFINYPIELGFLTKFLEPNHDNLVEFGDWFQLKCHTEESFPSYMLVVADNLANEYLEKYTV